MRAVHEIRAEMTANVWLVRVEPGASVAADDEIVVLESMKMEIPVEAGVAGVVRVVHVTQGSTVHEGDLIAEVAPS